MKSFNYSFFVARYVFFALFTLCNAIICSVAVWNHSLVQSDQASQVGVYLIFLGAFSLVSIFILIFVELLYIDPFTTRVWFECGWIALFWIMELAGAAAVAAVEPDLMCSRQAVTFVNSLCTSGRVLLAFTWICTIMLLICLVSLVVLAVSQHYHDPEIWFSSVRTLVTKTARRLPSAESPPSISWPATASSYTSQSMYSKPPPTYLRRGGLSAEYEIESFHPTLAVPEQMDVPFLATLPEAVPHPPAPVRPVLAFVKPAPKRALPPTTGVRRTVGASAWHPSVDQLGIPRSLPSSIIYAGSNPLSTAEPVPIQSTSLPSPSPLGDWPRQDAMQQPITARQKRKAPPSAFEFPKRQAAGMTSEQPVPKPLAAAPLSQPRRPSGPRLRVPSEEHRHQPAPLDLSGISNYQSRDVV